MNYIIDSNFQISYLMVIADVDDEEPEDDTYGDSIPPASLPQTVSSFKTKEPAPVLPADNILISETEDENSDFGELNITSVFQRKISTRSFTRSKNERQSHTALEMIKIKFHNIRHKTHYVDSDLPAREEAGKTTVKDTEHPTEVNDHITTYDLL